MLTEACAQSETSTEKQLQNRHENDSFGIKTLGSLKWLKGQTAWLPLHLQRYGIKLCNIATTANSTKKHTQSFISNKKVEAEKNPLKNS